MSVLEKIDSPADLKKVSNQELEELASEIRTAVLHKVSNIGGHVGPSLGVTELTIALHKVFNSPIDKFIWDVSHQTYPHKILTGRKMDLLMDISMTSHLTPVKENQNTTFSQLAIPRLQLLMP